MSNQSKILNYLEKNGISAIHTVSSDLNIKSNSLSRTLKIMEEKKLIKRVKYNLGSSGKGGKTYEKYVTLFNDSEIHKKISEIRSEIHKNNSSSNKKLELQEKKLNFKSDKSNISRFKIAKDDIKIDFDDDNIDTENKNDELQKNLTGKINDLVTSKPEKKNNFIESLKHPTTITQKDLELIQLRIILEEIRKTDRKLYKYVKHGGPIHAVLKKLLGIFNRLFNSNNIYYKES
jgi:DNA-binding Lrp family transcriptional regulator